MLKALKRRNIMYLISILICTGVALLIANGAYLAIFKSEPIHTNTSELSSEEQVRRAYRSAYFSHVSLIDAVGENVEADSSDY